MHSALLIDEILQVILEACATWTEQEYRSSLCRIARCCKTWSDPALDRLWVRLDGITPLVRLLPQADVLGQDEIEGAALARFCAYAHRVRSIRHTDAVRIPSTLRGFLTLPRLASIRFRDGGCQTVDFWGMSSSVREVDIHFGFSRRRVRPDDALTRYLKELHDASPNLDVLRVRGTTSAQFLRNVSVYTALSTLDLRVGTSLSMELFCKIATTFAALRELTVDARHLDAQELLEGLTSPTVDTEIFISLRDLTLQAKPALASALLQLIPSCTLETFHLDAQWTPDAPPSPLRQVFAHLPDSVRALSLECFDDVDIVDRATLRPLARLAGLRRFDVQVAVTPCLHDQDARDLAAWWPNLEHFVVGAVEDVCGLPRDYGMTPAVYAFFARSCPALRSLALPVHIPASAEELPDAASLARTPSNANGRACTAVRCHPLRRLDIGTRKTTPASIADFCNYIHTLFPSLTSLEASDSGLQGIDLLQQVAGPKPQSGLDTYYHNILTRHGFTES
ncbi:hypothetical protein DAEQUDRAFT_812920 [Daedalea quercina L-15889]|uniref:F-box domain-containing protein n=1 Tax=Daedalea quercina L-15889 TaxID=1314783 RepID=A0A165NTZ5_9APHY|nr:hypothetical protein DAEQUDRAFT_812920 [Daedalea quercina L-15889]